MTSDLGGPKIITIDYFALRVLACIYALCYLLDFLFFIADHRGRCSLWMARILGNLLWAQDEY